MSTLKSPLPQAFSESDVHQRLRKCLSRCTLDCGFKTSESPALRGFEAERCPITGTSLYLVLKSNGLRHSKNPPVKFSFSLKIVPATIAKKLPPQRCFKPLLIPIFNFPHKWLTFAFTPESGYTPGFRRRIAHKGTRGETGVEMSRNVQSGNTQNLKSMVIQRSFPKRSVAERRKTAAASDQAAVCACAHSRYFTGGSPSGLRV